MTVYGVDPGSTHSAVVVLDAKGVIVQAMRRPNVEIEDFLWMQPPGAGMLVIEQVRGFGRTIGNEVLDTAEWTGRFLATWDGQTDKLPRKTVVTQLTGDPKAGDREVREALIARWGGRAAIQRATKGTKTKPGRAAGPLGHITADLWSALSVAVVWRDMATLAMRAAEKRKE